MDDRMDELLSELPPPREEQDISPWRRPVFLTIWGILLTTVTLNFLYLDTVLPAVGLVLMYLGLRSLRRENGGFRTAWLLSIARLALNAVSLAVLATPFGSFELTYAMFIPGAALQIFQLLAIRAGLGGAFDRAGAERRLKAMNWLAAFQALLFIGAILNVGSLGILGFGLVAVYIGVIIALLKLPKAIADTGYALRNAPVRLGDWPAAAALLSAVAFFALAGYFTGIAAATPRAEPFTPAAGPELSERMPEEIVEILPAEDRQLLSGAVEIQYTWSEDTAFPDGTAVRLCTVTAELPGTRLVILHYFRYLEGGPRYGDGFTCSQSNRLTRVGRYGAGDARPTGSVVYERGGETYRSDLVGLQGGSRTVNSILGADSGDRIWGDVYAPMDAGNVRGFVLYVVMPGNDLALNYSCQISFLHTGLLGGFQKGSPSERLFTGGYDRRFRILRYTAFLSFGHDE